MVEVFSIAIWVTFAAMHGGALAMIYCIFGLNRWVLLLMATLVVLVTVLDSKPSAPRSAIAKGASDDNREVLKIMTFNLRHDLQQDGVDNWSAGRQQLAARALKHDACPDVAGIQEALASQLSSLTQRNGSLAGPTTPYRWLGASIGGPLHPEFEGKVQFSTSKFDSAILYNSNTVVPIRSGTFWLSASPLVQGSSFPGAGIKTCTWALFEAAGAMLVHAGSSRTFFVFNTHLDHLRETTRRAQAKVILTEIDRLTARDNAPVFMTGDFNTLRESPVWQLFHRHGFQDTWPASETRESRGRATTFHHFWGLSMERARWRLPQAFLFAAATAGSWREALGIPATLLRVLGALVRGPESSLLHLDWVLVRNAPPRRAGGALFKVKRAEIVITASTGGTRYASDHYPVLSTLQWQSAE